MSWPFVILGEIVENCNSKRIPLKQAERLDRVGDYDYYGASGVIDKIDDYLFDGDYLLIGEDGNNLISRSSPIAFHARGKFWVNNHAHVLKSNGKADLGFLAYYINSINLEPYVTGSAQPKLNKKNLDSIKIPLPPLDEQKRIAAILDKADAIRRKRRQAIDLADDFLRSVFLDMFGDPVNNPKGWEVKSLNEISVGKGVYGSGQPAKEYSDGDYRYIRITDITSSGGLKEEKVSLENVDSEIAKYSLEEGDLLFARTGATVGKTFLYNSDYGKCIYAGYLIKFKLNDELAMPEFIKSFTDTSIYWSWIKRCQKVVAQPNINAKQYGEELLIPIPPKDLQIKFVDAWKRVNKIKRKWKSTYDNDLFNSLSQQAFTGEL